MIELRAFVPEIESARKVLDDLQTEYKGYYQIHDTIYSNKITNAPLTDEFLRIRHLPTNIWDEKSVILAVKKTLLRSKGKTSDVPIKLQFDTIEEAKSHFEAHFSSTFAKDFEFWREGWQYHLLNGDVVDLEIIENDYPSIELKSETEAGIDELVKTFSVASDQIIAGPSVATVKKLLYNQD